MQDQVIQARIQRLLCGGLPQFFAKQQQGFCQLGIIRVDLLQQQVLVGKKREFPGDVGNILLK